jgi:hypothetical protein
MLAGVPPEGGSPGGRGAVWLTDLHGVFDVKEHSEECLLGRPGAALEDVAGCFGRE